MINQKNYYTEYLKRDDQILVLRLQNEENRNRMAHAARDRDRELAHAAQGEPLIGSEIESHMNETPVINIAAEDSVSANAFGSKIIIIHPGSQNLRVGLASDVLPKTTPMVIARKSQKSECEERGTEPRLKRRKVDEDDSFDADISFENDFTTLFTTMTADLKSRLRKKGRRIVPNSREQAVAYNRKSSPEIISEHNDSHRIEWTDISGDEGNSPEYFTGWEALRIPDFSKPRYKLHWPIKHGVLNENDYSSKTELLRDFTLIIEEAIKSQVGLRRKSDWAHYDCVFVVPDLYERFYVTTVLDILFRDFEFSRVCFIQESVSASFGAGYSTCVIVDVGAEKTSICCVDEGMCVENSRINLAFGGLDVTESFIKMMLFDQFPYSELNLNRRYDFLLAEELKQRFCTMVHADIGVHAYEFFLRAYDQNTRHYSFKTYDEVMLAPMGFYQPDIFNQSDKLRGRRRLLDRSYDLYDGSPNDPLSSAQAQVLSLRSSAEHGEVDATHSATNVNADKPMPRSTPNQNGGLDSSIHQSPLPSPGRDGRETPQPARGHSPTFGEKENLLSTSRPLVEMLRAADVRDSTLPLMALDKAIILSIENGARGDERKMRDFFGGIIPIGGGSQINGFNHFLEEELADSQPQFRKEVIVAPPPREIDPQVLVWKGASVFGKLEATNDSWISGMEYDRLGSRLLAYKCLWSW